MLLSVYPKILSALTPAFFAIVFGFLASPVLLQLMERFRMWKRMAREENNPDTMSTAYERVHDAAAEKRTPRVGGVIILAGLALTTLFLVFMQTVAPGTLAGSFDFTSRNQTLIPIVVFFVMGAMGFGSDLLQIYAKAKAWTHGYPRLLFVGLMLSFVLFGSYWFYVKLGVDAVLVPAIGQIAIGWLFVPFFVVVAYGVFSSGVIDGIDGLAAGVMMIVYAAYGIIAYNQAQYNLSAYCFAVAGSILPFLWFNIPPARVYMGEVGMLALTSSLTFVAFLTGQVLLLPIIAFPLFITALSSFIQIISKRYFKKKVFLIAPLHHHFEALGWSRERIVMKYWVCSILFALAGVVLAML
jgi:phospho-N-acetylmuramoyl-pentapeptide-transferase